MKKRIAVKRGKLVRLLSCESTWKTGFRDAPRINFKDVESVVTNNQYLHSLSPTFTRVYPRGDNLYLVMKKKRFGSRYFVEIYNIKTRAFYLTMLGNVEVAK